jgi:hypothetical protein
MKIRRKTRKRGGMVPRRVSSSGRASSSREPPNYNDTFAHLQASKSPETGTGVNRALVSNRAAGTSTPISHNIATVTNRVAVSNAETQKSNNNNGLNIPTMTEDELLQQYTSVYEKMTSKEDAAETAALLKPYLKTIQNPIAFYITAHMDINNDGAMTFKNVTLHAFIITRNDVYFVNSTFKGLPINSPSISFDRMWRPEMYISHGFPDRKNVNTLTVFHTHTFKKHLDSRLIHMFQTISKIPAIGQTTTGWMPDIFRYPYPIGNPINNGMFMAVCRAL